MANGDEEIIPGYTLNHCACNEMQTALTAITDEINKLNETWDSAKGDGDIYYHACVFNKLIHCKYRLVSKNKLILKFKENLRTAYFVAKTSMTAKKNEISSLQVKLKLAKNQIIGLIDNDKRQSKKINSLIKENKTMHEELENFKKFVENGYQQLQNSPNIIMDEQLPTIVKLKNIFQCFIRNDADYNNIQGKYEQIFQKNQFLNNKLNIINQNLDVTTSELFNLRNYIKRLQKENYFLRNNSGQGSFVNKDLTGRLRTSQSENIKLNKAKFQLGMDIQYLDLESHINLVKKMLLDQELILKELTSLSVGYLSNSSGLL